MLQGLAHDVAVAHCLLPLTNFATGHKAKESTVRDSGVLSRFPSFQQMYCAFLPPPRKLTAAGTSAVLFEAIQEGFTFMTFMLCTSCIALSIPSAMSADA
jgi:hypothetical protein